MELINRVRALVEEELQDSEFFVVDVLGGDKSKKISVLLDGDNGITIQKCSQISRSVSKVIDEESFESDAFILEISSPGADRPLLNIRQYNKHVGRTLELELKDGSMVTGKLNGVSDNKIELTPKVKKSKQKAKQTDVADLMLVSHVDIAQAKVVISFK